MDEVRCQISRHDIVTEVITLSHWLRVPARRASSYCHLLQRPRRIKRYNCLALPAELSTRRTLSYT